MRCAAIDLGAGSGRVISADFRDDRILLSETYRFENPLMRDASGTQYWDLDTIEAHARRGLQTANAVDRVDSVGVDSWGVDYVLLDADRRRVGLPISYRDHRTDGVMPTVFSRISREDIYGRTGIQFLPFNSLYQLAATARQHPEWLEHARHFLMVPDYLNFRLCGVIANEYTNATTTQLYSLQSNAWDPDLLAVASLSRSLMPSMVEPGTVIGATACGDHSIRVIAVASHDTASAVAGAPLKSPDEAFISSGTWSLMGMESVIPFVSAEARHLNFSNEGGYRRRYRVLKNITGLWLLQQVRAEFTAPAPSPVAFVAAAEAVAPWRSLINPDDARFLNPPSMTSAIREFCVETGQPVPEDMGSLARCIFDSLALSYRRVKEELESLRGRPLSRVRIVGGGSQNRLLNQLCADACQLPVSAGPVETSALGNACVQMIALGALRDIDEARAVVRRSFPIDHYEPRQSISNDVWRRFQSFAPSSLQEVTP